MTDQPQWWQCEQCGWLVDRLVDENNIDTKNLDKAVNHDKQEGHTVRATYYLKVTSEEEDYVRTSLGIKPNKGTD